MARFPKLDGLKQGHAKKTIFQKGVHIAGSMSFSQFLVIMGIGSFIFISYVNYMGDAPFKFQGNANYCQVNTTPGISEAAMVDAAATCIEEALASR